VSETKKTYVYFIQRQYSHIKIGVSSNPEKRLRTLQTGSSIPLRLIATFPCESRSEAFLLEKYFHENYAHLQVKGEWFKRILIRELKIGRKRVIGGTYKDPIVKLSHIKENEL
jgi:predicted GIY-YIG superfamily endonuclease